MDIMIDGVLVTATPEQEAEILEAQKAFDLPPTSYTIPKTLPWRRMTEAEAETMETAMRGASAKLRQIYAAATELNTADEFWPVLEQLLASQFGEERASELLAATD